MDYLNNTMKATAVKDSSGAITAFVDRIPGLVVQGRTMKDVEAKLNLLIDNFIKKLENSRANLEIETQTIA